MSAKWKLVPVRPTQDMKLRVNDNGGPGALAWAMAAYPDMLAAAPLASEDAELVEALSRVIDPVAWDDRRWTTTRADVEEMHRRRQIANKTARDVLAFLEARQ